MPRRDLLVIGYAGDPTIEHFLRCLDGRDFDFLELFEYYKTGMVEFDVQNGKLIINCGSSRCDLNDYRSIFQRLLSAATSSSTGSVERLSQARFRALDLALL